jgi:UDP-N-acetyl-2-amino-2-deoxyglucuronate dehydrogenase
MNQSSPQLLRAGIVGCGKIAHNHVRSLQALEGVLVVAVTDKNPEIAEAFAAQYGIDQFFGDSPNFWNADLDLVTICTPHPAHEEGVVLAAQHSIHVLCEKPVAVTLESLDRMIAACDQAGVVLGVLFQRRFWEAARTIRTALDSRELGQPVLGSIAVRFRRDREYYQDEWRGRWDTEGGGVLINQAIHHIDLLQWFMGPAISVSGSIRTLRHTDVMEVEDSSVAHIEFTSWAIATVLATSTLNAGLGGQVMISDRAGQTASVIEFPEGIGVLDVWTLGETPRVTPVYNTTQPFDRPLPEIHHDLVPYHAAQIKDFVDAVREGRNPSVTGREARKSLAIVLAIYESSKTGQRIDLTAPGWSG